MGESEEDVKTYRAKFDIVSPLYPIAKYCDKSLIMVRYAATAEERLLTNQRKEQASIQ